jgi:hypothetical protein
VTLRARWVTLRARWVTLKARFSGDTNPCELPQYGNGKQWEALHSLEMRLGVAPQRQQKVVELVHGRRRVLPLLRHRRQHRLPPRRRRY